MELTGRTYGAAGAHVVMVPLPVQSHIVSMISLAQYLAKSGIMVTLVHTARSHTLLASAYKSESMSSKEQVRVEVIPDGLPSDYKKSMEQMRDGVHLPLMRNGLEELLRKLMHQDAVLPPPCCLILDFFLSWSHDVALTFHLPRIMLWTGSATVFSIGFHFPQIIAKGLIPATQPGSLENVVDFIPGVPPIRIVEILGSGAMPQEGLQNPGLQIFVSLFEHSKDADCILANTIYELESSVVDALRKEAGIPIHPIGPMFMINSSSKQPASLLREDASCLSWLDKQQESSVLYISFGSMVVLDDDVLTELAYGLEASEEKFIWVIRPDAYGEKASIEEILPEGFMERTQERGRVIEWAPQVAVLGHSSVGAFVTHCGWTSVVESLSKGVPMLCFPQQSDQMTNCKSVVHEWKAGLPLINISAGKVERSQVERAISGIMREQEGIHARKRARAWRHIAPSQSNLQKLVSDIKLWSA